MLHYDGGDVGRGDRLFWHVPEYKKPTRFDFNPARWKAVQSTMIANLARTAAGDVRLALRSLRFDRAFAGIAVLTLAIGIGATTAIFSVVNAALLRPLPFPDAGRLVSIYLRMPVQYGARTIDMVWSYPKYQVFRRVQRSFDDVALHLTEAVTIGSPDGAYPVVGELVSANYLPLLGVHPARGRFFIDSEDNAAGGTRSLVIGDGMWRAQFGADRNILGRVVEVNGNPYRVVGVAPAGFAGMSGAANLWLLYTAVRSQQSLGSNDTHQFEVLARLRPGVSPDAAKRATVDAGRVVDATYPGTEGAPWGAVAYTLRELRVDPAVAQSVLVLGVAVIVLLLIACVNLANLLLARGAARRRELSVRLAIGAAPSRIVRQLLTESLVLAGLGAVGGLVLAAIAVRGLAAAAPVAGGSTATLRSSLTKVALGGIGIDARALGFTIALTLVTGVIVGLLPAIAAARAPLADAMRQGAVATPAFAGLRRLTGRGILVMSEIALAIVLLVASGLTIRTLERLLTAQVGYDPEALLTARISLAAGRALGDSAPQYWTRVLNQLSTLPGVAGVAIGSCAPVGDHCEGTTIHVRGHAEDAAVAFHVVSADYFRTLRVPLIRGRAFDGRDQRRAQRVMIINETAARTIWGSADPLTTPVEYDSGPVYVVGIVGDTRYEDIESPARPAIFVAYTQGTRTRGTLFVRVRCQTGSDCDPTTLAGSLRREVRGIDPGHALSDIQTMRERMFQATARNRFSSRILAAFAGVALLLAAIGIYGVLALAVTQRRRELGIRLALGAEQRSLLTMVLGQAISLAAAGGVIGIIVAVAVTRALGSLVYGVSTTDPPTYVMSAVVLAATAVLAALVPAWRAARVDPTIAMRAE